MAVLRGSKIHTKHNTAYTKKNKKFALKKWNVIYDGNFVGSIEVRDRQDKVAVASQMFEPNDDDGFPAWDLDKLDFHEIIGK